MKNLLAATAIAMFVMSPVALAQNESSSQSNDSAAIQSGGAAGSGGASTLGATALAVGSTAALVVGAVALSNSGEDDENVEVQTGTTGTVE